MFFLVVFGILKDRFGFIRLFLSSNKFPHDTLVLFDVKELFQATGVILTNVTFTI